MLWRKLIFGVLEKVEGHFNPGLFNPKHQTPDLSTSDFSTMNFPTPDFLIPDVSTLNFSTPDFSTPDFSTPSLEYISLETFYRLRNIYIGQQLRHNQVQKPNNSSQKMFSTIMTDMCKNSIVFSSVMLCSTKLGLCLSRLLRSSDALPIVFAHIL